MLPEEVIKGIQLFNQGDFFAAHEALENAWRAEKSDIRYLYQGILQVGVACYHLQRGNYSGADHLLTRGLGLLAKFEGRSVGIDLSKFLVESQRLKQFVERTLQDPTLHYALPLFPQVELFE